MSTVWGEDIQAINLVSRYKSELNHAGNHVSMYYNGRALGKVYLVSILLQATSTDDILSFYLRLYQSTGLKRHQTTEHLQTDFSIWFFNAGGSFCSCRFCKLFEAKPRQTNESKPCSCTLKNIIKKGTG